MKVFLSYSSANRDRVSLVADALTKAGVEVWWDHALNPGEDYRQRIEKALSEADAVVVCWTPHAAGSDWVISEADHARQAGKLFPVLLQHGPIPKPFDRLHTLSLTRWRGSRTDPDFLKLAEAVRAISEGRAPRRTPWRRRLLTWGSISAIAASLLAAIVNLSALSTFVSGLLDPVATSSQVAATNAKVEELIRLLMAKSPERIDRQSEEALRTSLSSLLSAQGGARGEAARRLSAGDRDGALAELHNAAANGEKAAISLAQTYREMGSLAFPDKTPEAIAAYERAVQLEPGDLEARNQLAHLYRRVGRLEEAQAIYERILTDSDPGNALWEARSLGNLGVIAFMRSDMAAADRYFSRALTAFGKLADQEGQAKSLIGLANIAVADRRYDDAHQHYTRSLLLAEQAGDDATQAVSLGNLGLLAIERGAYADARELSRRALAIFEKVGTVDERASQLLNLGNIARADSEFGLAREYFNRALVLYENVGATRDANAEIARIALASLPPT